MDNQVVEKVQEYVSKLQSFTKVLLKKGDEEEKKEWMATIQCLLDDFESYQECYPKD